MVEFTDGSKKRVTPSRVRILSQYGTSISTGVNEENNIDVELRRQEELVVDIQGVSLRVEGYLGGVLTPMLKMDSKITANVKDWSSKMVAQATASLQASYYNENVAEWEPVIEALMENRRERPWQLSINVRNVFARNFSEVYSMGAKISVLFIEMSTLKKDHF